MIVALAWLTVCLPVVYKAQEIHKELSKQSQQEDNSNPLTNTTEEKNESSVNTLNEYLHEMHALDHPDVVLVKYFKCNPTDLYLAYHPEAFSPPPEA
jgi:hypothetical protein